MSWDHHHQDVSSTSWSPVKLASQYFLQGKSDKTKWMARSRNRSIGHCLGHLEWYSKERPVHCFTFAIHFLFCRPRCRPSFTVTWSRMPGDITAPFMAGRWWCLVFHDCDDRGPYKIVGLVFRGGDSEQFSEALVINVCIRVRFHVLHLYNRIRTMKGLFSLYLMVSRMLLIGYWPMPSLLRSWCRCLP